MHQPHHHIGHLHARVVDVVLHPHLVARRPQQPHKRVAQNRVAQVPDVRRLVGIDPRVLHQHLARGPSAAAAVSSADARLATFACTSSAAASGPAAR